MIRKTLALVTITGFSMLALSCCCCCGGIGNMSSTVESLLADVSHEESSDEETTKAETSSEAETTQQNTETIESTSETTFNHEDVEGAQTVTVMVYLNGTDLEEDDAGSATEDLKEMLSANMGDNVNVVIETIGTKDWQMDGISGDTAQRFVIRQGTLMLTEKDLGQVDVTEPEGLTDFIQDSYAKYPADRYMLVLWNHGGGPVYGYGVNGWDSDSDESMTLDEIQSAVSQAGVHFDMIGFDACLMGSLEVAYALKDQCDYLVVSEDFESGMGWEYKNWLTSLSENPDISMKDLGKIIVDDFVKESEEAEDKGILAVLQTCYIDQLWNAWVAYGYETQETLVANNVTFDLDASSRAMKKDIFDDFGGSLDDLFSVTMDQYSIVDLGAVATVSDTESADLLKQAIRSTIIYAAATDADKEMTGLSVCLPYGDDYTYEQMENIYTNIGIDAAYLSFLSDFAENGEAAEGYDWSDWDGLDEYEDFYNDWFNGEYDDDYWDDYWDDYGDDYWENMLNDWINSFFDGTDSDFDWGDFDTDYDGGDWDDEFDDFEDWDF